MLIMKGRGDNSLWGGAVTSPPRREGEGIDGAAAPAPCGGTDKAACLRYYTKPGLPGINGVRCGMCVAASPSTARASRWRS